MMCNEHTQAYSNQKRNYMVPFYGWLNFLGISNAPKLCYVFTIIFYFINFSKRCNAYAAILKAVKMIFFR